jgi:hypothetical protein
MTWAERIPRGHDESGPDPGPGARSVTPELTVLALQRSAGNQAVCRLLARSPFNGNGAHRRTDVRYATELAAADTATLDAAPSLSSDERGEINEKLAWFTGAAHEAYAAGIKSALIRATRPEIDMSSDPAVVEDAQNRRIALDGMIRSQFTSIQKLKVERINAWEKTAELPTRHLGAEVLEVIIAIVSEGLGGAMYGVIEKMMEEKAGSKLVTEFVGLAGLEAADLAAEKVFRESLGTARLNFEDARQQTQTKEKIKARASAALATKGGTFAAYAEAMRLQTIDEEHQQNHTLTDTATESYAERLLRNAALELIYAQLLVLPHVFLRDLTSGYIRLLEEAKLTEMDKEHGGDREKTFEQERVAHTQSTRPGNLVVTSADIYSSIGDWWNPDLDFPHGFVVEGEGVNVETLDRLLNSPLSAIPVTLAFSLNATSPFSNSIVSLRFVRDPAGNFFVNGQFSDDMEWLASYYTRQHDEHTDSEREFFAPFGAKKLYEAVKAKRITKTE